MEQQEQLQQLQNLFTTAQDILIITKEYPSIDGLCACLGLYGTLYGQRTVQGKEKNVVVAVSGRQGSQYTLLPFSDKIVSELGLRDLVISINGYVDNSIQNVTWYADKGRLHVVFKANPAVPMQFDLRTLDPFYAGANFNVVVVIDTATPADLGNAYRQDPGMYSELPVVNISTHPQNSRFGKINIVDSHVPAVCELVYQLTQVLRYSISADVATLFKLGILDATQNLQKKGPQTEYILDQLNSYHPRSLDLNAVRQQGVNPPIAPPVAPPQPVSSPQSYPPPYMPYPSTGFQYPSMPYVAPPYVGYVPPNGYSQIPAGYYPVYPISNPAQVFPQTPGQSFIQSNQPYQQSTHAVAETVSSAQNSSFVSDAAPQEGLSYEVPSFSHDMNYSHDSIPTSPISGHSHVAPVVEESHFGYTQSSSHYSPSPYAPQYSYNNSPSSYSDTLPEESSSGLNRGK